MPAEILVILIVVLSVMILFLIIVIPIALWKYRNEEGKPAIKVTHLNKVTHPCCLARNSG